MLTVGVIGAGEWGKNHVRVLSELPEARLGLVCDIDAACRKRAERTFGVDTVDNVDALLSREDIDAVSVCTPASTHGNVVRTALEAGKHVLVEKPFSLDAATCEELITLAADRDLSLMVGHIFRFDPAVEVLKREIETGTFGRLYVLNAARIGFRTPRMDCGVIFDFAVHDFDTLCYILGAMPTEVNATASNYLPQSPHEDVAYITLRFPPDILATISVSWLTPRKVRELWLVGESRSAQLDLITPQLNVFDFDYLAYIESNGYHYESYGAFKAMTRMGNVTQLYIEQHEPLRLEISHFIECVTTGARPRTPGEVGRDAVRIAEAAVRSSQERAPVPLSFKG